MFCLPTVFKLDYCITISQNLNHDISPLLSIFNQELIPIHLYYRGVYLACLLYHGDKVLVTSDDQLPVVEVDENFSGPTVNADLHWLMKVR